jgi:tRNA threonylcarbamoyl adenosine modification protein (Sua5/YciO/YrdC/YwlC family)
MRRRPAPAPAPASAPAPGPGPARNPAPAPRWRFGEPVEPLAALLAAGGVVAIPTESSYALGALPASREGVETVYRIKRRERGKPLPVVVAGLDQLAGLGIAADLPILKLLSPFWPGPLTAVLPIAGAGAAGVVAAAAGGGSLALRIPGHPQLLELLARLGHGLTATSANRSGGEPILDPGRAAELLAGERAMVVDGGVLPGGPPSTLVAPAELAEPAGKAGDRSAPGDAGMAGAMGGVVVLRAGRLPVERLRERLTVVEVREG